MFSIRLLRRAFLCLNLCSYPAAAQSISPVPDSDFQAVPGRDAEQGQPLWIATIQELPMFRLFGVFDPLDALLSRPMPFVPPPSSPPCPVAPLRQIDDPDAMLLEESPQDNPRSTSPD